MTKYLVETYYTCSFKVKHYLDKLNQDQLSKLDQREDGKFEIIDVKLDTRKTKNLAVLAKFGPFGQILAKFSSMQL